MFLWMLMYTLGAGLSLAASNPCDPSLLQDSRSPYGYKLRGDRCEGLYQQQVSSSALILVSFTSVFDNYDLSSGRDLLLDWIGPRAGEVRLRARSIDRRVFYRMDALCPPGSGALRWPTSLLAALEIRKTGLGLLAFTDSFAGEGPLYLPIRARQNETASSNSYQVSFLPGRDLEEVYVTLAAVAASGVHAKPIRESEPLRYGYYPAGQRIDFPVTNPGPTGTYYLEIGATLKSGGSVTLPVLFYHSGRGR